MRREGSARCAGVMLPITALPSAHGVGDMGEAAYRFVDMLAEGGVRLWQILPIHPLGYGNSPYQPYSSFAGDPLLINPEALLDGDLPTLDERAGRIRYEAARAHKEALLRRAFAAFVPDDGYSDFVKEPWAYPYAVFMALKRRNGMRSWLDWPEAEREWPRGGQVDLTPLEADIRYELFAQYVFHRQWKRLKAYAGERDIRIVGDIPIYVGIDSADVWTGRENFLLDEAGAPTVVAGVPPDYFSATGQRWGNPIYDWAHLEKDGFGFWIDRLRHSARLFDIIRIDHFRGFDTYWEIPAACPTAVEGEWKEAPGYALLDAVEAALPHVEIIAEDLGMLRDEVYALRDAYGLKGMHIIQFTFDPKKPPSPRMEPYNMVVYTGTHDNDTTLGWYRGQGLGWRLRARRVLRRAGYRGGIARRFVRLALDDAADYAVIPLQDILDLGSEARLNTPGTVGSPNWEWKLASLDGVGERLAAFGEDARRYGR